MRFETPAQKECYGRVFEWMDELFGESLQVHSERPEFALCLGSAVAQTIVLPFQDDALVATRAYVVNNVSASLELYQFLLRQNDQIAFASFGLDDRGDIFLEHSVLGSSCSLEDLSASVRSVALMADALDDVIVARWGGERALDRARKLSPAPLYRSS